MPDVSSNAPAAVRPWVCLDVHKFSIVAATLPPAGGQPELQRIETTEQAIRRLIDRLGGPDGLAIAYEAGPGGFGLLRLLRRIGVACDVNRGARRAERAQAPLQPAGLHRALHTASGTRIEPQVDTQIRSCERPAG